MHPISFPEIGLQNHYYSTFRNPVGPQQVNMNDPLLLYYSTFRNPVDPQQIDMTGSKEENYSTFRNPVGPQPKKQE